MAGGLNRSLPRRAAIAILVGMTLAAPGPAAAQAPTADPTRPPAALDAAAAATAKAVPPAAGLQTIIRRQGAKPVAVINGETVELGGKIGAATLVRLGDAEAVLQGPQGREVLRLTPNAEVRRPAQGSARSDPGTMPERRP